MWSGTHDWDALQFNFSVKRGEDDVFVCFGFLVVVAALRCEQLAHAREALPGILLAKEALAHLATAHLEEGLGGAVKALSNEGHGIHVLAALVGSQAGLQCDEPREGRGPPHVVIPRPPLPLWLLRKRRGRERHVHLAIPLGRWHTDAQKWHLERLRKSQGRREGRHSLRAKKRRGGKGRPLHLPLLMVRLCLAHLLRAQPPQKKGELVAKDLERPGSSARLCASLQADGQDVSVHIRDRNLSQGVLIHQALHLVKVARRHLQGTVKESQGQQLAALNVVGLGRAVELIGLGKLADVRAGTGKHGRGRVPDRHTMVQFF